MLSMNTSILSLVFILILNTCGGNGERQSDKVYNEVEGKVTIEAESFYKQDHDEIRKWYLINSMESPKVGRDDDFSHAATSSGGSYLEILPDTRVTHDDELIHGENFSNEAGKMAFLYYKVKINNAGRYYVWVRAYSNGGEDNGIHVGLDGEWPASGQRMQWCDGKKDWRWESKQRTEEVHCGEPWKIYLDIDKSGVHEIMFSMREDGFEFDKFIMVNDTVFRPSNEGPSQSPLVINKR